MESGEERRQRATTGHEHRPPRTNIQHPIPYAHSNSLSAASSCSSKSGAIATATSSPGASSSSPQRIGGQVIGAFDGDTLIGFAMSLPGYRDGKPYLHSHMLAVLPQYRNAGIGRRLKLAQRDDAIARGFDLMEWTFDPLEIRTPI